MDSINTQGGSHWGSNYDIDSVDSHQEVEPNRSDQDDHPSRPSSRLGFNLAPSDTTADSDAIQWSRSLFQNVGITDLRVSSIKACKTDMADSSISTSPKTLDNGEVTVPFPSGEQNAVESPSTSFDEDSVRSPAVPRKSPTSVSRLCFPFVLTPSPRRKDPPPPPPPTLHKYSCSPSLMSPVPANRPSPTHQRHSYRQHGYSRLALQHMKWFWAMREDEWEGYNTFVHGAKAYGGISSDAVVDPTNVNRESSRSPPIVHSQHTMLPMTIHPRRGDIAALRDPYSTHIDRCFVGLPTWTIGKTLWMYDMHMASERRQVAAHQCADEDSSDYESENELDTSTSTGFSDDSDTTLVESESETDVPRLLNLPTSSSSKGKIYSAEDTEGECIGSSSTRSAVSNIAPSTDQHALGNWSQSVFVNSPKARNLDHTKPPWATNWYHRWEVLVDLSRQDRDRRHAQFEMNTPALQIAPLPPAKDASGFGQLTESDGDDPWDAHLETV